VDRVGRARSGCGAALVGSTDQVLSEIESLSEDGHPRLHLLRAIRIWKRPSTSGRLVLPELKTCSLPVEYGRVPARFPRPRLEHGAPLMERVKLSETLELSRIVYGMWRLGDDADTSPAHVQAKVEACLAQGITTMDQADIYGGYGPRRCWARRSGRPGFATAWRLVTKCDIVAPIGRYSGARVKHYDTSRGPYRKVASSTRCRDGDGPDRPSADPPARPLDGPRGDGRARWTIWSPRARCGGRRVELPALGLELLQSAMETPLVTNQIELSANASLPSPTAISRSTRSAGTR
jgi:hypothetical protein